MSSNISLAENNFSVIQHPNLPFVILRTDYLALAKGNHCAAKLLAVFENWTNWFVRQGKLERWVRLTGVGLDTHLLGEHNKAIVQKALTLLIKLGFIRREQRRKHRHDRAWFYWFDIERVQEAVDALQPSPEPETEQDYLGMEASLEARTLADVDLPEMVNRVAGSGQTKDQKRVIQPPETGNLLNINSNSSLNSQQQQASEEIVAVVDKGSEEEKQPGGRPCIPAPLVANTKSFTRAEESPEGKVSGGSANENRSQVTSQPSVEQVNEVLGRLLDMGIARNHALKKTIKEYYGNVDNAIAYLKECQRNNELIKNLGGLFVAACREGRAPEGEDEKVASVLARRQPTEMQLAALEEAKQSGAIRNHFSLAGNYYVEMPDTMCMGWSEYLNL